ncbi:hypothetical protein [Bradyrhizobium sp. UFLA05-112]
MREVYWPRIERSREAATELFADKYCAKYGRALNADAALAFHHLLGEQRSLVDHQFNRERVRHGKTGPRRRSAPGANRPRPKVFELVIEK